MTQNITAFDAFCGAGGSSTGLVNAGIEVKYAVNHWSLAIETHNTNHPLTDHDIADLQVVHPARYPRTTILWASPSCTNHSLAQGRKRKNLGQLDLWGDDGIDPAEEKSRMTMQEIVVFAEYHQYEIVIVENVVDIRYWTHYDRWLNAMLNLGYDHRILYLNAQFFGVPQSRDRFYAVFWKRNNRRPDLEYRPLALCTKHGEIQAVQSWKKEFQWGRYGARRQYVYRCPQCGGEVTPYYRPAADVIDWSIESQTIGSREKPLKEKTVQRILAGLRKFGHFPHVADLGQTHAQHNGKVKSVDEPLATQTTRQQLALVEPFIASQHGDRDAVRTIDRELPCITTMNNEHSLVTPPYLIVLKNSHSPDGTYTLPPKSLDKPLSTIAATSSQEALITPPLLTSVNYFDDRCIPVDEPLPTQTTASKTGLVTPPIIMTYNGEPVYAPVDKPMPTVTTLDRNALITPDEVLPLCGFRMLRPGELQKGMSFPATYIILGGDRDKVRQIGNAVCPNVAQWIAERCVESLA